VKSVQFLLPCHKEKTLFPSGALLQAVCPKVGAWMSWNGCGWKAPLQTGPSPCSKWAQLEQAVHTCVNASWEDLQGWRLSEQPLPGR